VGNQLPTPWVGNPFPTLIPTLILPPGNPFPTCNREWEINPWVGNPFPTLLVTVSGKSTREWEIPFPPFL
jgi:hypothetical protein